MSAPAMLGVGAVTKRAPSGRADTQVAPTDLIHRSDDELSALTGRMENVPEEIHERFLATVLTLMLLETKGGRREEYVEASRRQGQGWLKANGKKATVDRRPVDKTLEEMVARAS